MNKNRLWLHVGPAKTGTSSLQTTFRSHTDDLMEKGLLYPRISVENWGDSGNNHSIVARVLQNGARDAVGKAIEALPPFPDTLISSEGFPQCGNADLSWFADMLDRRYRLRVIYYMRDPVDYAISVAGQKIKAGRSTYADIIAEENPVPRFRKQIRRLSNVFGKDRMIIREFSPQAFYDGNLISDFCYVIGRKGLMEGREVVRKDGAITMKDIPYLEAERGLRDSATFGAEESGPENAGTKFTLPADFLDKVRANAVEDLEWLFETYGIDFRETA